MSPSAPAAALESAHTAFAGKRALRIALTGYRSNPFSGGQGIYLKYLSRALVDAGHRVDVISGEPYPELDPRVRLVPLPGLNLYAQPNHLTALRPKHLTSATDLFEWWSMATGGFPEPYTFGRRLKRFLNPADDQYDIVHDNQCLAPGVLALQQQGMALTTTIHHPITSDRDIALAHAERLIDKVGIRRWHHFLRMQTRVAGGLRHIVTVSECSKRDIASAFSIPPERITVVYNGIDGDTFRPLPHIARNRHQIITTASADQPLKGMQHLLPALKQLRGRFPDLKLLVIGKPKPGGSTERTLRELQLEPHVEFRHGLPTEALVEAYAQSLIAVVPSEYEGFGLPAGEAMACGVPLVSTDGGALPEVVGDAGVVVPAGDANALAEGLAQLLDSEQRREALAVAGRQRILSSFSWDKTAERMTAHYEHVISAERER